MIEALYTKFVLPLLLNTLYSCFSANLRAYVFSLPSCWQEASILLWVLTKDVLL